MKKILLLDIDGVLILRDRYFSHIFSEEYHVPYSLIDPFFQKEFPPCLSGNADLKEIIAPYLPLWGWDKGVDAFLEYWFETESNLNTPLLTYLETMKDKVDMYLTTDNEKYRCEYIWEKLEFKNRFKDIFASSSLHIRKKNPQFFETVAQKLGVTDKKTILFTDDDPENIESATHYGIESFLYQDEEHLKSTIRTFISS